MVDMTTPRTFRSRMFTAPLVVAVSLLAVGCGGEEDPDGQTPGDSSSPAAPVTPGDGQDDDDQGDDGQDDDGQNVDGQDGQDDDGQDGQDDDRDDRGDDGGDN